MRVATTTRSYTAPQLLPLACNRTPTPATLPATAAHRQPRAVDSAEPVLPTQPHRRMLRPHGDSGSYYANGRKGSHKDSTGSGGTRVLFQEGGHVVDQPEERDPAVIVRRVVRLHLARRVVRPLSRVLLDGHFTRRASVWREKEGGRPPSR